MPVQTTVKDYVYFPDGCKVEYSTDGSSFTDIGAINSDCNATYEYDVNEVQTANAGTLARQIRNMRIAGGFTLINLNPAGIATLSGGAFTATDTAGTELSGGTKPPNQTIAANWVNVKPIPLTPTTTAGIPIKCTAAPVLTSVTGSSSGACAANDDYTIITDPNSFSGYSIVLNSAGTATLATSETVVIVYTSAIPVASTLIKSGTSTQTLTARALRFTHTDSATKTRVLTLFAVDVDSGGFQFNFKGANSDGIEEMPLSFTAKLDTTRTSGDQLFNYHVDAGAT